MAVVCACLFLSCSNNDDEDNKVGSEIHDIEGLWFSPNGTYQGTSFLLVYNFINYNTVINYSTVSSSMDGWASGTDLSVIPGHAGWYYSTYSARTLTYYVFDNKIFISDGTILTISGSTLLLDDSSVVFRKWA